MNFAKVKSYKDISKVTKTFAAKRGLEILVGKQIEQNNYGYEVITGYQVEIWDADENAELFLIAYTIQNDGALYLLQKTTDLHKELHKVEDLPLIIRNDKQLRSVIDYVAECLK